MFTRTEAHNRIPCWRGANYHGIGQVFLEELVIQQLLGGRALVRVEVDAIVNHPAGAGQRNLVQASRLLALPRQGNNKESYKDNLSDIESPYTTAHQQTKGPFTTARQQTKGRYTTAYQ